MKIYSALNTHASKRSSFSARVKPRQRESKAVVSDQYLSSEKRTLTASRIQGWGKITGNVMQPSLIETGFTPRMQLQVTGFNSIPGLAVPPIQAKLTIGHPNDKYEQEADRVAAQVVQRINMPAIAQAEKGLMVQRREGVNEILQMKSNLHRQETMIGEQVSPELNSAINSARRGGQPLDASLQQSMGQAMGVNFSGVRVHTDARSDQLNQSIQAKAFTTGQDVFFRQGTYQPESLGGQELIAHELTHVVQQNGRGMRRSPQLRQRKQLDNSPNHSGVPSSDLQTTISNFPSGASQMTQRYFLGAASRTSSTTILIGQNRQADHSFRNPAALNQIAMSGNDPTATPTSLKISEDGKMAIENVGVNRQAKVFFATSSIVKKSTEALTKRGSTYLIQVHQPNAIDVVDQKGKTHTLDAIEPVRNPDSGTKSTRKKVLGRLATAPHGTSLTFSAACIPVAEAIMGKQYGMSAKLISVKMKKLGLLTTAEELQWGTAVADAMTKGGKRMHGALNETTVAQAYGLFINANPGAAAKLAKKLKVNEFSNPKVGQAFVSEAVGATGVGAPIVNWLVDPTGATTTHLFTPDLTVRGGQRRTGWGNHAGAVVAASGGDKVTLENYARKGEDPDSLDNDNIFYFAMYGPISKPSQTWHTVWRQGNTPIANAVTGVIG